MDNTIENDFQYFVEQTGFDKLIGRSATIDALFKAGFVAGYNAGMNKSAEILNKDTNPLNLIQEVNSISAESEAMIRDQLLILKKIGEFKDVTQA